MQQTASLMPPYLVTLAFADLASGHEDDGLRADILQPLFDASKYPESARIFTDWCKQLSAFPE